MLNISNFGKKLASMCLWQHQKSIVTLTTRTFKSDLSLDSLYPNSKQQIFTPPNPTSNTEKFNGFIPLDQLQITYDRSSGPGGQNVNKVATKVDLRFNIQKASWLNDEVKQRMVEIFQNKINSEGFLVIKSDVTRFQQMNLAEALEKLRNMIRKAEKPLKIELSAEKLEKLRMKKEESVRNRLLIKRRRSDTKSGRAAPNVDL